MSIFTSKEKRVDALRSVAIFEHLPKKDVRALDQHVTATTVSEGTELAREGRAPTQMFLIVDGSAVVRRGGRKVATLGPGDTVGELSLLDGGKQSATVVAETDCEVLAVAVNEFRSMLEDSPAFTRQVLRSLAARLRATTDQLAG